MIKRKNLVGYRPKFVELDKVEALDVDDFVDFVDFKIAELMYQDLGFDWLMHGSNQGIQANWE